MTESEFQSKVVDMARWLGWMVYHPERAQIKGAWLTPGSHGFPDLVLVHPRRGVIFVELKTEVGRVSEEQMRWLHALSDAGAEAYVWRPGDWNRIIKRLDAPYVPMA